jgi:hypothetical protein
MPAATTCSLVYKSKQKNSLILTELAKNFSLQKIYPLYKILKG